MGEDAFERFNAFKALVNALHEMPHLSMVGETPHGGVLHAREDFRNELKRMPSLLHGIPT